MIFITSILIFNCHNFSTNKIITNSFFNPKHTGLFFQIGINGDTPVNLWLGSPIDLKLGIWEVFGKICRN